LNILITGGCGFIGVNLIRHLLRKGNGHKIRVVDNLSVGTRDDLSLVCDFFEVVKDEIRERSDHNIELIVGDIQDTYLSELACRGTDAVVHLAANTGVIPSIEDPRSDFSSNVTGSFNYLEASRGSSVVRFVFASSGAPLGDQTPPINEEMVPHPISPYGASKLAAEGYCSAFT